MVALGVCLTMPASAAAVMERVRFASLDRAADGAPQMVEALWLRPAGDEGRALPAVIALHGCDGVYSTASGRRDQPSRRHRQMAELLVGAGYAVLFPDSFRSRGREEICTEPARERTIGTSQRRADALGALRYLQARRDVLPGRIALLGWSHGGSTVLATVDAALLERDRDAAADSHGIRAAIAFYPSCIEALRAGESYRVAAPLLLLVGAADDWTSPRPCTALAERLQRALQPATIVVYADTYHGFDGPGEALRRHLDVPGGVHPGQGVTVAVNPRAREDALVRVKAVLREALAP